MIENFDDFIFSLLNPVSKWEKIDEYLVLKINGYQFRIKTTSLYNDIVLEKNDIVFLSFSQDEKLIVWRAISFLLGGKPHQAEHVNLKEVSLEKYYPEGGRKNIPLLKKEKKHTSKITNAFFDREKKDCLFEFESMGTLGEILSGATLESVSYNSSLEREDKPYFSKIKNNKENKSENKVESLVLWDMENVHFFDDFSILSRKVKKENQLKIVSFSRKHKSSELKHFSSIEFKLNKIKKRGWIINSTKNIADDELISEYFKYRESLKELIVISSDSDFKEIILDALNFGIKVIVINNSNRSEKSWFENISSELFSFERL